MKLFLKNALFTALVPGTVGVYVPLLLTRGQSSSPGSAYLLAVGVLGCGGALYLWCVWEFATSGKGTPAPVEAPKRLVVQGLYKYCRNPMYVGVLLIVAGWAMLYSSLVLVAYLLGIWAMFHTFIVLYEEPQLRRIFGEDYLAYCARVPRWIPRFGGVRAA